MAASSTVSMIKFPSEDEMLTRLICVSQDPCAIRVLYPILLRCAGRSMSPKSFGHTLWTAVRQYRTAGGAVSAKTLMGYLEVLIDKNDLVVETAEAYAQYAQQFG